MPVRFCVFGEFFIDAFRDGFPVMPGKRRLGYEIQSQTPSLHEISKIENGDWDRDWLRSFWDEKPGPRSFNFVGPLGALATELTPNTSTWRPCVVQ